MSEQSTGLTGPDFSKGFKIADLADQSMLQGHALGEPVLVARRGQEIFAIGAICTHYGAPLASGLMVGDTVRCPWHHACFSLRTGEALAAPALTDNACWKVEKKGELFYVTGKAESKPNRQPKFSPQSVVIIGAGAAGGAAAEMLRREGYAGPVTLVGADEALPYDRPNLSKDYLAGSAPEEWIPLRPNDFYREQKIEAFSGTSVQSIDPKRSQIRLSNGKTLAYGALLLATGSDPIKLSIPGSDLAHVHYLRTLRDCRRIIEGTQKARRAVVIGASFIGLEVAASLRARKLEVAVIGRESQPLERVLGAELGGAIRQTHERNGVKFYLGRSPDSITATKVKLDDGTLLDADIVVIGVGVKPNTALAEEAGIATDRGVLVNEYLETSVPGIFAAGDIARWPDPHSGQKIRVEHWVVAQRQGQTAARNILGAQEHFTVVPFFWSNHFDFKVHYTGHASPDDRVSISGDLKKQDAQVTFSSGSRTTAVATVGRDTASLEAEVMFEKEFTRY